ncbi:hypothetical protein N7463_004961 [Penicillium fimorum]|uniref:Uncharacterized protein n=1 Tax=Penicillium fimorum TaxID=1882269 RepID=A0A9X0C4T3_9EURO|nr:hypothetical protein N7463_004961 [Penicillium fimorum]
METQVFDERLLRVPSKDSCEVHAYSIPQLRDIPCLFSDVTIFKLSYLQEIPIEGADVTRGSLQKDVSNREGLVLASF